MLYSEFLNGTGTPENMLSYTIYTGLERIYMRHDEYTREEAYRDGRKILEDLGQVAIVKRTADKVVYYHGMNEPFSYRCGHCGAIVKEDDVYCRFCGAEFEDSQEMQDKKEEKCCSGSLMGKTAMMQITGRSRIKKKGSKDYEKQKADGSRAGARISER